MQPTAMSEKYEWWRNFSRANELDERQLHAQDRVAQGDTGVGEAARVDDGERDAVGLGRLHAVDQLVFGVALEGNQLVPPFGRGVLGAFFDRRQGVRAINLGFPLAQEVQVRSVEQ
jgi:hypothetical protein